MDNDRQLTCGTGLAANAALPAKLGALTAARAEVLERHTRALDLSDPNARQELDAYTALVRAHRDIAARLEDLARAMVGCVNLVEARHDMGTMADPAGQTEAFQRFMAIERELLELLQGNLEQEEKLLP
jgi:hypothetical protein